MPTSSPATSGGWRPMRSRSHGPFLPYAGTLSTGWASTPTWPRSYRRRCHRLRPARRRLPLHTRRRGCRDYAPRGDHPRSLLFQTTTNIGHHEKYALLLLLATACNFERDDHHDNGRRGRLTRPRIHPRSPGSSSTTARPDSPPTRRSPPPKPPSPTHRPGSPWAETPISSSRNRLLRIRLARRLGRVHRPRIRHPRAQHRRLRPLCLR